jgi:hypothetical protein
MTATITYTDGLTLPAIAAGFGQVRHMRASGRRQESGLAEGDRREDDGPSSGRVS